jgi:hypothetical protein
MKKLILLVTLIATPAFAQQQQTPEQRTIQLMSQDMGNMYAQVATMVAKLEEAQKRIKELESIKPTIEEKK